MILFTPNSSRECNLNQIKTSCRRHIYFISNQISVSSMKKKEINEVMETNTLLFPLNRSNFIIFFLDFTKTFCNTMSRPHLHDPDVLTQTSLPRTTKEIHNISLHEGIHIIFVTNFQRATKKLLRDSTRNRTDECVLWETRHIPN